MSLTDSLMMLAAIHFVATVSPGPEFVLISKETLSRGRRAGFICQAGTLAGLLIHISYSALGLAAVIAKTPQLLILIQLLGGAYLIWLGIGGLRAKPLGDTEICHRIEEKSALQTFRQGFLCDLLNPKATVYCISLFTFVLSPDVSAFHISVYSACFMLIHTGWFTLVVLGLSNPQINSRFRRAGHWLDRILGGAMVAIGVKMVLL